MLMMLSVKPERRASGFSLIELLVALLVSAVGILGMLALQGRAQQSQLDVYQRAQAMILIEDIVNRMLTNGVAGDCYDFAYEFGDAAVADVPAGTFAACNAGIAGSTPNADQVAADFQAWHDQLRGVGETLGGAQIGGLRDARGCVEENAGVVTVSVAWLSQTEHAAVPANDCGAAAGALGNTGQRRVMSVDVRFGDYG